MQLVRPGRLACAGALGLSCIFNRCRRTAAAPLLLTLGPRTRPA